MQGVHNQIWAFREKIDNRAVEKWEIDPGEILRTKDQRPYFAETGYEG